MRSIQIPGDPLSEIYGIDAARECQQPTHYLEVSGQPGSPGAELDQQVRSALDRLSVVLDHSGYGLAEVIRLGIFTTDVDGVVELWPIVRETFAPAPVPPHTLVGVARLVHPGVRVEIEATAVRSIEKEAGA